METGHGKLAFGHGATPTPESANDVTHCQEFIGLHVNVNVNVNPVCPIGLHVITKKCNAFGTHPGLTIFLLGLIHVTLTLIQYAFAKRGVVMILNRGRRRWVINCSSPEAQPIAVLELALGESLLSKCFMSIFKIILTGFAHYTRQFFFPPIFNVKFQFFLYTFRFSENTMR